MAKKTYKILRFDGVDEMGKLVVLGDANTAYKSLAGAITNEGRGLFAVSTDYNGLLSSGSSSEKIYYLVENGTSIQGISSDGSETGTALTSTGITSPSYYFIDRGLRIGDADHSGGSSIKRRGYFKGATYGGNVDNTGASQTGADAVVSAGWISGNAAIDGCFPTYSYRGLTFCRNATVVNVADDTTGDTRGYGFNGETSDGVINYSNGAVSSTTSTLKWGVALEFDEDDDGSGTGGWMPNTTTQYLFYITTMYDGNTQESLPQIMDCNTTTTLLTGSAGTYAAKNKYWYINFTDGDSTTPATNVAVRFRPVIKFNGGTSDDFNFGGAAETAVSGGDPRISGFRIYWSSNEDGHSDLWELMEIDFFKGVKAIGADAEADVATTGAGTGLSPLYPFKHDGTNYVYQAPDWGANTAASTVTWVNPPRILQYDVLNSHSPSEVINVDSFKTAVVSNRRVYIGNIEQDGVISGDRMIKSPVNQFDKFPKINNIDVAINDGDEIVLLLEFADRILQFKKNICYVINVGGASEFLEQELRFKGISNPGAATRTDYGIAWVNNNGCFLYDGNQVTDLLEEKGLRKINQSTWESFISTDNEERIGFNPSKKQIIIKGTSQDIYLYDMVTKSWVTGTSALDANTNSNFINDPKDGKLLIHDGSSSLDKWSNTPSSSKSINIVTKDIDFGEPAIRKKIYKVYITYKSNSSSLPALTYDTDGNTGLAHPTTPVTAFTNTSNQWTVAEYTFGSDTNNCKSIQLKINGTVDTNFEINDISFIYRSKTIK